MTRQKSKVDSEIVKARNRARSYFRREAERMETESLKEAREVLRFANLRRKDKEEATKSGAIVHWTTETSRAVLASLDITPRMDVQVQSYWNEPVPASAMTDYETIYIQLQDGAYNENDPACVARLIALTKGLIYHEAGHILYTIPFQDLKGTLKDEPLPFARTKSPLDSYQLSNSAIQYAWNLLEDQRMESAVVRTSPIIQRYLQIIVMDVVVASSKGKNGKVSPTAWPFVSGRTYLPKEALEQWRAVAVDYAIEHDLVETLNAMDRLIREYKSAKSPTDMMRIVYEFAPYLHEWLNASTNGGGSNGGRGGFPNPVDSHTRIYPGRTPVNNRADQSATDDQPEWKPVDKNATPQPTSSAKQEEAQDGSPITPKETPVSDGNTDADNSDNGSDDSSGNDEVDDEPQSNEEETSAVGHGEGDVSQSDDQRGLEEIIGDLINEVVTMETVNDLIGTVNDAMRRSMPYDPSLEPMDSEETERSYEIRNGMLGVLEPLAVQADPSWRFRQEDGVLDPTSFRLHDTGDTDYWVGYEGDGATGHDLAVSVVLDVSMSMDSYSQALSVSAMGIRLACDELDIPCTLTTFSSNGYIMLDATAKTEMLRIRAHGGTDPVQALDDLANQTCGKSRHLIVVLTDGEWDRTVPSFSQFRTQGSYIIGVGFGSEGLLKTFTDRSADAVVNVSSVEELPKCLTNALIGYLV